MKQKKHGRLESSSKKRRSDTMKKLLLECEERLTECQEYVSAVSQNMIYGDYDGANIDLIKRIELTLETLKLNSKAFR